MTKSTPKVKPATEQYTNKVFQTLLCLEDTRRKQLLKYLQSPYFVQSKVLELLYTAFLLEIDKGKTAFDRQKIWQKIAPGQAYEDVNFRKYCSDLLKHIQDFMAHEVLSDHPTRQAVEALEFIVEHKVEPLYKSAVREAKKRIAAQGFSSASLIQQSYQLEQHYFSMMDFEVRVDIRANLEEISHHLDVFYWIEKLKIYCYALSHQKTGNYRYDIRHAEEIVVFLRNYPVEDIPELAIHYYSFLMLFEEDNVEHYYRLIRLLEKHISVMPQKEAIELVDSALHYCTGKINKSIKVFNQEYFNLSEDALSKGIFIVNGMLAPWRFNNMVAAALRLGKLDWAEKFIRQYHVYLSMDTRENTYSFNLARVYRYQGQYDKVLELLINVEYEDIGYNLISKAMLLITYYELSEYETLISFTSSFRTFLTRHKNIPPQRRQGYLNLIKYTRRLIRLNFSDKAAVAKLHAEITREKATTINHEWLLEKLS